MPASQTITAFYSFTPSTAILSAQVNNNFSLMRGHFLPIDGSASSFANNTYDLGSSSFQWRAGYFGSLTVAGTLNLSTPLPEASGGTGRTAPLNSEIRAYTGNGHGSTNTKIRRFTNSTTTGSDITYSDSSANGASITINTAGVYFIQYTDYRSGGATSIGLSINSTELTTSIASIAQASRLHMIDTYGVFDMGNTFVCRPFAKNDVIRPHGNGDSDGTNGYNQFYASRVC